MDEISGGGDGCCMCGCDCPGYANAVRLARDGFAVSLVAGEEVALVAVPISAKHEPLALDPRRVARSAFMTGMLIAAHHISR